MRACLLLLALLSLNGCSDWRNRIDNQILDCGDSVRGSSDLWIKILDPKGRELPGNEELDARPLSVSDTGNLPPPLAVSEKHCVQAGDNSTWLVRSRATERSWSVLVNASDLPWDRRIRLEDSSQQQMRLQCPEPWINAGRMILPLVVSGGLKPEAVAVSTALDGPDGRRWTGGFGLQSDAQPIVWPQDWPDGSGRLVLVQQNLLQSLTPKEESCPLEVDRARPALELTPAPDAAGNLDLRPGSLLRLRVIDAHPGTVRWCLGQADACTDESKWNLATGEVSVSIPDRGRWFLRARAVDAAGNSSELLQQPIDVIQGDVIQTISARVDQALAEKNVDGWQARLSLQQALSDYQRLVLPKEQALVKNKLVDGILAAAPMIQERQRATVTGSPRRVWALNDSVDSPWLVLTDSELSLWTKTGTLLQKLDVGFAEVADWSAAQKTLVIASFEQLQVVSVVGQNLVDQGLVRWSDLDIYGGPTDVKWVPQSSQLVVTIDLDLPVIFDYQPGSLQLRQQLDLKDARLIAVAPGGDALAVAGTDQVSIWRKNKDEWHFEQAYEKSVRDLRFTAATSKLASQLLILSSDGSLSTWTPGVLKEIDKGVPGEEPTVFKDSRSPVYLQPWADGTSGVFERGGRVYQWSSDASKTLQLVKLKGAFNWEQLKQWKIDRCRKGLWLLDDRTLSFWQLQDRGEPIFSKAGEWPLAPDSVYDFVGNCNADDREFITLDARQKRLRFWSQRGPLPMMRDPEGDVVVSRFLPGLPGGEALFTAGFGWTIRAWNKLGEKLTTFIGHQGQVNEMRFMPELQQFASSAEDGSVRLWSTAGQETAKLIAPTLPPSVLRDSSVLIDPDHLLSAGSGAISLWNTENSSWKLTITIPLAGNERAGFDSVVRLPARAATAAANSAAAASPATGSFASQARALVRVQKKAWRGLFIDAQGTVQNTEPGLPPLENLKRIEWTADGSRLALVDAQGVLSIFRAVDAVHESIDSVPESTNGPDDSNTAAWMQESIDGPKGTLSAFAFAPDGRSFAVRLDSSLQIWEYDTAWEKKAEYALTQTSSLDKGLLWTADGRQLIYAQEGIVRTHDRDLKLVHQFQAFPETSRLAAIGVAADPEYFSVAQGSLVRIIDLNLERLEAALKAFSK